MSWKAGVDFIYVLEGKLLVTLVNFKTYPEKEDK